MNRADFYRAAMAAGGIEVLAKDKPRIERLFVAGKSETKADDKGTFSGYGALFGDVHPTATWSLPSDWSDTIAPGAFSASLAEHKARGTMPTMLCNHEMDELPVGAWTLCEEDKTGLRVEGQLALKTARGAEVYELMQIRALTGLSVAYRPIKVSLNEKKKLRTIEAVDLYEISPVGVPAIPGARVTDVKALDPAKPPNLSGLLDACAKMSECKCVPVECEHKSNLAAALADYTDHHGDPASDPMVDDDEGKARPTLRTTEAHLRDAGWSRSEAKAIAAAGLQALDDQRDAGDEGLIAALKKLKQTIAGE